jgi:NTP pyrophosphatase (non-canonical NTP hydrolase)
MPGKEFRMVVAEVYDQMINALCAKIYERNVAMGWYTNPITGASIKRNTGEQLMLIVSEIAEAMEGHRKGLKDDKLPHRDMIEVELADACIRIFDLAGSRGMDLGGAIVEKRAYNENRADHKIEARMKLGGKSY